MCSAKIKVQRYIFEQKVRIEWFQDSPDHSYALEESERLKRSQIVRDLVIQKAVKNYRPPEIVSAVTSTNSLESYYSELKRTTSPQHGLIDAFQKIVALDKKKRANSEHVAYEFRTKKISAIGKAAPGLTFLNCNCLFFHQYLLSCRHIFHENMYGTMKLLISDVWKKFQQMFEESGFEIYIHCELVDLEVPVFKMTEAEKAMENRWLAVSELTERIRDIYWRVKKKTGAFISKLKNRLEPVLNIPI
ncbi:hypothetical protein RhiirA4_421207 [Rhizophagus irregularis]|uniref:SWIM-type domain-containing protein n=1 Tax=Rhizophagus irregularis TaxID=588596 RepID=A0A2I1GKQ6_9GLOM|nr:hypothetical protein RhiirA4_421207 [Rhizophagus irregularis]